MTSSEISDKRKGKKAKAKRAKAERPEKPSAKRKVRHKRSGKSFPQDMISGRTGTPKSRKKTSLRMKKFKRGLLS